MVWSWFPSVLVHWHAAVVQELPVWEGQGFLALHGHTAQPLGVLLPVLGETLNAECYFTQHAMHWQCDSLPGLPNAVFSGQYCWLGLSLATERELQVPCFKSLPSFCSWLSSLANSGAIASFHVSLGVLMTVQQVKALKDAVSLEHTATTCHATFSPSCYCAFINKEAFVNKEAQAAHRLCQHPMCRRILWLHCRSARGSACWTAPLLRCRTCPQMHAR